MPRSEKPTPSSNAVNEKDRQKLLSELDRRIRGRKLFREYAAVFDSDKPGEIGAYPWQAAFHNAGSTNPERMIMAGNRVGKTSAGAAEMACHLTGQYPAWWEGRKFTGPVRAWAGSESSEAFRDIIQAALLGQEGEHGTGWLPRDSIIDVKYRQAGVANVMDMVMVRHSSGGVSMLSGKTYEQGVKKWMGAKLQVVWLDEEPPQDIYSESMTRVLDSQGLVYVTFTPLAGFSDVVRHFIEAKSPGIWLKNVTWDDAPHLNHEEKERLWLSYPANERKTRSEGVPMMGTGAVFPIEDDLITIDDITDIPLHWYRINGIDFGIDHPAAGAFCAWEKDSDTFYILDGYRRAGETPIYHAAAMRKYGDWIPTAWPHDGIIRDKGSGIQLKDQYRSHGLYMLPEHAAYADERGNHVEPGIIEMDEWMRTGRFKVCRRVKEWFEEKRLYHREDGKIIAKNDDLISASRYAFVMRRFAVVKGYGSMTVTHAPKRPILSGTSWRNNVKAQ